MLSYVLAHKPQKHESDSHTYFHGSIFLCIYGCSLCYYTNQCSLLREATNWSCNFYKERKGEMHQHQSRSRSDAIIYWYISYHVVCTLFYTAELHLNGQKCIKAVSFVNTTRCKDTKITISLEQLICIFSELAQTNFYCHVMDDNSSISELL